MIRLSIVRLYLQSSKKHNLFEGFYFDGDIWTKEIKFPEEENALYEFTKKLIKLLKEDIESIYSRK